MEVGIDDMSVYVPELYVDMLNDFAEERDIAPGKLEHGIGIEEMSVPDVDEDAATMAAEAVFKLMKRNIMDPSELSLILVGTETGLDESKNLGGYIIGMLEQYYGKHTFEHVGSVEYKTACAGATYAFLDAVNWVTLKGGKAIVVSTDVAKYPMNTPGEYTQGAGAVATLVTTTPRIAWLEPWTGFCTRDVDDFFRPIGHETAQVRGKFSIECYLEAMDVAVRNYFKAAMPFAWEKYAPGEDFFDGIDAMVFHIPFTKMATKVAARVFRHYWGNKEDIADFIKSAAFQEVFEKKVEPSLKFGRRVGNIYTGSIWLGLYSFLSHAVMNRTLWVNNRIGMGSYGSGLTAVAFSLRLSGNPRKYHLDSPFGQRHKITMDEYEGIRSGEVKKSRGVWKKRNFFLDNVDERGYRHYGMKK
jgi:hydroxymethylglutaryl-CoA synthase|tara:strand:- start:2389 stop:3633 length:1245 start_codon:yes stop_codon:yes gene_type:complete